MRLIDADKVPALSDLCGCAYEGSEYQAYKSGAEYGARIGGRYTDYRPGNPAAYGTHYARNCAVYARCRILQ